MMHKAATPSLFTRCSRAGAGAISAVPQPLRPHGASGAKSMRPGSMLRMHAAAESTPAAAAAGKPPAQPSRQRGHQAPAPAANAPAPDPAEQRLREHQSAAVRQPFAEECRTLVALSRYGVISTLAIAPETQGFPIGSVVGYAADEVSGAPIFSFSTMSGHTRDVMQDGRASLTVTAPGFQGAADARVCVTGRLVRVPEEEREAAVARYLAVHPDAFWVTYGDFSLWRMAEVVAVRLVGGFGRAGSIPPKLYHAARPDPVAGLTQLVAAANAHGSGAWVSAVHAAVGADVGLEEVRVVSLDRLGLNLMGRRAEARKGGSMKLRLAFAAAADSAGEVEAQVQALLAGGAQ